MTIVLNHLGLMLVGSLLLASPAEQPADAPSGWQEMAGEYAALEPAAQQQWIRELLRRLDRANRTVLPPAQAAAEQARHAEVLGRTGRDRQIPPAELLELLRRTDQREKAAIERLARQFRIRVYETFRVQRIEFARRRAAWDQTLAAWEAAGGPFDRQHRLIDWLEAAVRNSTAGSVTPLPPTPRFDAPKSEPFADAAQPDVPQVLVDPVAQPRPPAVTPDPVEPLLPAPSLPEPDRGATEFQAPRQTTGNETPLPGALMPPPVPVVPHESPDHQGDSRRPAADRPSTVTVRRPAELPLVAGQADSMSIPPMQPAPASVAFVAGVGPRRAAEILPGIAREPLTVPAPSEGSLLPAPAPAAAQRLRATDRPAATANLVRQRPSRTVGRPEALLTKLDYAPQARPVERINLAELAARTAGTNLALQKFEAELDEHDGWNARRLGPMLDRLRLLVLRRNDLALFHDLISPQAQAEVGRLESPHAAVSRLAARIVRARAYASGARFPGSEAQRQAELQQLDGFARQLTEMAGQK